MSLRSMTGFARVRKLLNQAEMVLTIKSVNHRGLDVHLHLPQELEAFENSLRAAVKRSVTRGHLQIQVKLSNAQELAPVVVNRALLEAYLSAFRRTAAVHGLHCQPDLNSALRVPGMFQAAEAEPGPQLEAALLEVLEEGLGALNQFRDREGAEIAAELRSRNALVRECVAGIEALRVRALPAFQTRLTERLAELLSGLAPDPQRLAQEAAFLTDRSDVSEEASRLKAHSAQLEETLNAGGEVGKKLDFLLQEMQRETNTILSKAAGLPELGLAITDLALQAKAEIEKIREQVLNLE